MICKEQTIENRPVQSTTLCICLIVIALFSRTILTIAVSCSAVKTGSLPPRRGNLSVLQNTQIQYNAPNKAFKLVFSCHSSVSSYLFSLLNVQRMDANENRLIFGLTLCPASCMVKPWLTIWLTTVARISSEIMALLLALSLHPLPPPPPPLPPLL